MEQPVTFLVGRMNPPTPGHIALIKEMLNFAKSIGAIPRAYITSTHNYAKMTAAQKKHPVYGLAKDKLDASVVIPYVKHKNYENPLTPEAKKYFIQVMLLNHLDMSFEESNPIVVADRECNGLFKAIGCVKQLQDDPDKIYFVMGKEIDPLERESRESFCINKSSGTVVAQDKYGTRLRCHFLERTEDEGVSGLSGSKVRMLAADNDIKKLYEVYHGYLSEQQVDSLVREIRSGLNMSDSPKEPFEIVSPTRSNKTKRLRSPDSGTTRRSKSLRRSVAQGGKRKTRKLNKNSHKGKARKAATRRNKKYRKRKV